MKYYIQALILIIGSNCFGQTNVTQNFQFKLGSTLSFPYNKEMSFMPGHNGFARTFKPSVGLSFEISFQQKIKNQFYFVPTTGFQLNRLCIREEKFGTAYQAPSSKRKGSGNINFSYVTFSPGVQYQAFRNQPFFIGFNPYFGILTKIKSKIIFKYWNESGEKQYKEILDDYKDDYRDIYIPLDMGLGASIEYSFKSQKQTSFFLYSKYNLGLISIHEGELDSDWKTSSLIIGFGINI